MVGWPLARPPMELEKYGGCTPNCVSVDELADVVERCPAAR
jgi:hypothetical protein